MPVLASVPMNVVDRLRAAGCVFAEEEAALLAETATSPDHLEALVAERVGGLPLEHVVGWAEFCGQRIVVTKGVFVPRHRTELLVDQNTGALFRDPSGEWAVYALRDGRAVLTAVKIGQSNGLEAEVLSGLDPGDQVVLHPSDRVTNGVKIQPSSAPAQGARRTGTVSSWRAACA